MPTPNPITLEGLWIATIAYGLFLSALFGGALLLPGKQVMGFIQPDGNRKQYKINGMSLWVATHIVVVSGVLFADVSLAWLYREFWSMLVVANVYAIAWSFVLMRSGLRRQPRRSSSLPLTALRRLKDLWMGVELNPTSLGVDLKVFAYHPSLIGLALLNLSFAFVQYEATGSLTPQMIVYQALWWLYLTTHYYYEAGVLSMWDVIAENFGFMLVWGDLVLVTFFYCVAGWWLLEAPPMPWTTVVWICALHGVGLWIFRGANAQKDRFKRDRATRIWGRPAQTLGGRLLISGWWGIGRKLNYTGEIMVYFSFAACTGLASVVPYLLPVWLCCLLPHRAWRDEKRCRDKYGELWDTYTQHAKFRMVPFVY